MDLPADDPALGLSAYADLAVAAVQGRTDLVLVAQSMGGFTAPLVAARVPLRALVFVNAMIPLPGESASGWGEAVGSEPARVAAAEAGGYSAEFDLVETFLHDVPAEVARSGGVANGRDEAEIAFTEPCLFDGWPDVPITVLVGRDDRLFPADFQVRVARERLGVTADVLPGGHLLALANPRGVADHLLAVAEPMIEVPATFRAMPRWWSDGTDWLDALPELVATQCARLGADSRRRRQARFQRVGGPGPPRRRAAGVADVTTGDDVATEAAALRFWDGRGTVRLVAVDSERRAQLLEWVTPGRSLDQLPLAATAPVIGGVLRRLAVEAPADASSTGDIVAADVLGLDGAVVGSGPARLRTVS